jgi:cell division protein ZapA (FtsZ GTPase activity inhibitor)
MIKFAGIGSRDLPGDACEFCTHIGKQLFDMGWFLRSGNAKGADQAFEAAFLTNKQILMPWPNHNSRAEGPMHVAVPENQEMERVAAHFHNNWAGITEYARKLFTRNVAIIAGINLDDPVDVVVYAQDPTKDNWPFGGTNHAIRVARHLKIHCYNILSQKGQEGLEAWIESKG